MGDILLADGVEYKNKSNCSIYILKKEKGLWYLESKDGKEKTVPKIEQIMKSILNTSFDLI